MQEQSEAYVVKLQTALSNKPLFIKVQDTGMSIDRVIEDAVSTLRNGGRPLEADQLEQLSKNHEAFSQGRKYSKGDLLKDIPTKTQNVGNQTAHIIELDLITSHSGGYL